MNRLLHIVSIPKVMHITMVLYICNRASQIFFSSLDRFLNQAMKMFDATEVVPINFVFFTASAIVAGMSTIKLSQLFSKPLVFLLE